MPVLRQVGLVALTLLSVALMPPGQANAAPVRTARAARPAPLAIGAPVPAAAVARPGGGLPVSVLVRNLDRTTARSVSVRLWLSTDRHKNAGDVPLAGAMRLRRLAPHARSRRRTTGGVPRTTKPGSYHVLACATATVRGRRAKSACRASSAIVRIAGAGAGAGAAASSGPVRPSAGAASGTPASSAPGTPAPPITPAGQTSGSSGAGGGNAAPAIPSAGPDPVAAAPPLSASRATSFADATRFLYTGADPSQVGVGSGAIDAARVVVLRGSVHAVDGSGLSGVTVTVLHHPELGHAVTRTDGGYDLAANGGAPLTLSFTRTGSIPAERTVATPWQDYVVVEPVTLLDYDATVNHLDPTASAPFQVARGSASTDRDGTRRATLLFPRGVAGTMHLPDGTTRAVTSWDVRATEFTVGDRGPSAMPGTLPDATGYTYAAEFSLDQAVAAGATSVTFDRPVVDYTEDFVDAPVGTLVPSASYDRSQGRWVAAPNGRIVKVISVSGGRANLDVDGDGAADGPAVLAGLGITDDERGEVATLYAPGQSLMRVALSHFSPWDHNFSFGPPPGAKPPTPDAKKDPPDTRCNRKGSIIGCEDQSLGEAVPVTGTPFSLTYSTTRQDGFRPASSLVVPVTPASLDMTQLKGAELTVSVGGRQIALQRWCNPADPPASGCGSMPELKGGITYEPHWDGKDAYGRTVQGRLEATIRVVYVYDFQYYGGAQGFDDSWAQFPDDAQTFDGRASCGNHAGPYYTDFFCGVAVGRTVTRPIGAWTAAGEGLGGWSLDVHHGYDPSEHVVHLGDGSQFSAADTLGPVSALVAGSGDGTPSTTPADATSVDLDYLLGMATGPDGSVYAMSEVDGTHGQHGGGVRRITRDGRITQFAGNGVMGAPSGDGGPATQATLGREDDAIAVAPDGSVLLAVTGDRPEDGYIRRIATDGTITTIAGDGDAAVCQNTDQPCDDGVPARSSRLYGPTALAVGPDGSVVYAERNGPQNGDAVRIRRIDPSTGRVYTIAGLGSDQSDDGEPARRASLDQVSALAYGIDGALYLAMPLRHRVDRIGTDGRLTRFAGAPPNDPSTKIQFGSNALSTPIADPHGLAAMPDGSLVVRVTNADGVSESRILRIAPDGAVQPVAGLGGDADSLCPSFSSAPLPAQTACIDDNSSGVAVTPDGDVLYTDGRYWVRKVTSPTPGFRSSDTLIPAPDGAEAYRFDGDGRHLETLDGRTGAVLDRFGYDGDGRLASVTDGDGDVTQIEHDAQGHPTAIVAPGGQRTALTVDATGRLKTIADPAAETTSMSYGDDGLLATLTDRAGGVSRLSYDADGRLTKDESPDGETKTLARTNTADGASVAVTTKLGRTTTYAYSAGDDDAVTRTVTDPAGAVGKVVAQPDGTAVRTDADGTTTTITDAADPRWGAGVPYTSHETITTPGGLTQKVDTERFATLRDPADPLSLTSTIERTTANGKRTQTEFDAASRTATTTSPQGRRTSIRFDAHGRLSAIDPDVDAVPAVAPTTFAYDAHGRLASTARGDQSLTSTYDARGRTASITDAAGHQVTYGYDDADRVTSLVQPGGGTIHFGYDADGNRTSLTTPGGRHALAIAPDGRLAGYTAPGAAAATHEGYDSDGRPASLTMAGGATIDIGDDDAGRLTRTASADADVATAYADATGRPSTVTRTPAGGGTAQRTAYTWDGPLVTGQATSGPVASNATFAYDDDLEPSSTSLTVGSTTMTQARGHDDDGLPTTRGPLTFTRDAPEGLTGTVSGGALSSALGYDDQLRLTSRSTTVGGTGVYGYTLGYDDAGRLTHRTETVAGTAHTEDFAYDADGRLTDVKQGATVLEHYAYDADGNRTSAKSGTGPAQTSTYDPQDRQLTLGGTALTVDADGRMTHKGADDLAYGARGELLSANVGGVAVTYGIDGEGRRVSRTTGGQTTRYFYADPQAPEQLTAVQEPDGTVDKLFYDAVGALARMDHDSTTYYVATDQVGSPRVVTDSSGAVVKRLDYDAFGRVTADTAPSLVVPIGFAGGVADATTGLVHFGARDYDPQTGRWTSRDPLLFDGGQTNLYAYADSNPLDAVDPSGLAGSGAGSADGGMQLSGLGDVARAAPQAVASTFVGIAQGALVSEVNSGALNATSTLTLTEHLENGIEGKAKSALKPSNRDDYKRLLDENGKNNVPYVQRLMDSVTDLWRRAADALTPCPDPTPAPDPGPAPRRTPPSRLNDY